MIGPFTHNIDPIIGIVLYCILYRRNFLYPVTGLRTFRTVMENGMMALPIRSCTRKRTVRISILHQKQNNEDQKNRSLLIRFPGNHCHEPLQTFPVFAATDKESIVMTAPDRKKHFGLRRYGEKLLAM